MRPRHRLSGDGLDRWCSLRGKALFFSWYWHAIFVFDIFLLAVGHHDAFEIALKLKLIPLAMIFMAMIRLALKALAV